MLMCMWNDDDEDDDALYDDNDNDDENDHHDADDDAFAFFLNLYDGYSILDTRHFSRFCGYDVPIIAASERYCHRPYPTSQSSERKHEAAPYLLQRNDQYDPPMPYP